MLTDTNRVYATSTSSWKPARPWKNACSFGHHQPRKNVSTRGRPPRARTGSWPRRSGRAARGPGSVPPGARSGCMPASVLLGPAAVTCNAGRSPRTESRAGDPRRPEWSCHVQHADRRPCPCLRPALRPPWSTPRARSSGCPSRGSTARRCSAGCSVRTPATGRSARWASRTSTRRYLDRTLVLETTFTHQHGGTLVLTDLLAMGEDNGGHRLGTAVPAPAGPPGRVHRRRGRGRGRLPAAARVRAGRAAAGRSVDGGVTARGGAEWLVLSRRPSLLDLADGRATGRVHARAAGETVHLALHRSTLEEAPARVWSQQELADGGRPHRRRVGVLVGAAPGVRRAVGRPGPPQRPGAAGPVLPAERRDRRRGRPRRCPRASAASATGTTATPGSATRASPWRRSGSPRARTRPTTSSRS